MFSGGSTALSRGAVGFVRFGAKGHRSASDNDPQGPQRGKTGKDDSERNLNVRPEKDGRGIVYHRTLGITSEAEWVTYMFRRCNAP